MSGTDALVTVGMSFGLAMSVLFVVCGAVLVAAPGRYQRLSDQIQRRWPRLFPFVADRSLASLRLQGMVFVAAGLAYVFWAVG